MLASTTIFLSWEGTRSWPCKLCLACATLCTLRCPSCISLRLLLWLGLRPSLRLESRQRRAWRPLRLHPYHEMGYCRRPLRRNIFGCLTSCSLTCPSSTSPTSYV